MFIVPISPITPLPSLMEAQSAAGVASPAGVPFANVLQDAMQNVKETQEVSRQDAMELALGSADNLHTIQINSTKAETAVNVAAGLTTKILSAYNEILRMQI